MPATATSGYSIQFPIPHDREVERNRTVRVAFFFIALCAFIGIPCWILSFAVSTIVMPEMAPLGWIVGIALGGRLFAKFAVNSLLIGNDGLTGFITTDQMSGEIVVYGPGTSASFPWEDRSKEGSYPLEVDTLSFKVGVPTTTSVVIAVCEAQWRFNLARLARATSLTDNTLEHGLEGFVEGAIAQEAAGNTGGNALTRLKEFNDLLCKQFMATENAQGGGTPSDFEDKFGLDIVSVFITHFEFSPEVQKARDAVAVAKSIHEVAQALYAPGDLDKDIKELKITSEAYKTLIEQALVIAQDAKLNVVSIGGADSFAKTMYAATMAKGGA